MALSRFLTEAVFILLPVIVGKFLEQRNFIVFSLSTGITQFICFRFYRSVVRKLEKKTAEQKTQMEKLEIQVRQLQRREMIGLLAGGAAHDFNNLLAAIVMHCEFLSSEKSHDSVVISFTKEIQDIVARAASLTRQLLGLSRSRVVQDQTVDLNDLIISLKKMLDRVIAENITIETHLESNLNLIQADPGQIQQVILNLVANATDAMPEGGNIILETSKIELDEENCFRLGLVRGAYMCLTIQDTGRGMDPQALSRIFEPLFMTQSLGKEVGLGLSVVDRIIKLLKGAIVASSEVGQGTSFKIYLPFATSPDPLSSVSSSTDLNSNTLVLVDDDEGVRNLFSASLRRRGYGVLVAANGIEALDLIKNYSKNIQFLLTDIVMPKMGGVELAKQVRQLHPEIHVLYMSGYTREKLGDSMSLQDVGFDILEKPFKTDYLVTKLSELKKRSVNRLERLLF